jgi:pectin methylesterase-like acyl-CoA thioesterase
MCALFVLVDFFDQPIALALLEKGDKIVFKNLNVLV